MNEWMTALGHVWNPSNSVPSYKDEMLCYQTEYWPSPAATVTCRSAYVCPPTPGERCSPSRRPLVSEGAQRKHARPVCSLLSFPLSWSMIFWTRLSNAPRGATSVKPALRVKDKEGELHSCRLSAYVKPHKPWMFRADPWTATQSKQSPAIQSQPCN